MKKYADYADFCAGPLKIVVVCPECGHKDGISMVDVDIEDADSFEVTYECSTCGNIFTRTEG